MKRFYATAAVEHAEPGFVVTLDGKPIRTPGQRPLAVPSRALAEAIAAEWDAQGDDIRPDEMALTRLANSALDRVAPERDAVVGEVARYAATDLVCYRVERPDALVERQRTGWQPLLDWLEDRIGARLAVTTDLTQADQPAAALAAVRDAVAAFEDLPLTALHAVTAICGSVVIGLTLAHRRIDGEAAWALAHVDEHYQAERWGEDEDARRRRERLKAEVVAAATFFELCDPAS